ncbi:transposase [Megasphaera elsdenii]|mgnify:FL=1|uniref:transposase n=1 Tax=Megasphaera elsdenii TaxID=907 RepID=UPI00242D2CE7|nr:transposase [Megasphaera elsdenii]
MLPKRKPLRLSTYDYTNNGLYFVTICTKGKAHILGRLENQKIKFTLAGHIVNRTICDMGNQYEAVSIIQYVIMPNHVHLVVALQGNKNRSDMSLSQFINLLKGRISRKYGSSLWQRGFYEHVVRNEADLFRIMEYIENNPLQWELDEER